MAFNIDEFNAVLDKHNGIQKPSLYLVNITIPPILQLIYTSFDFQDVSMLCVGGVEPGPVFMTIDNFRYGYGLSEKVPFNTAFTDQTFSFIGDGESYIKNFFRDWMRGIHEYPSEGDIGDPNVEGPNRTTFNMQPWMLNYKDDYATTITIQEFDITGKEVDEVILQKAYPINYGDIQLGWDLNDQFMIIPITMTYRDIGYNGKVMPSGIGVNPSLTNWSGILGAAATLVNSTAMQLLPLIKK